MRLARTRPIMARLMTRLEAEKHLHTPKGPMGSVAYALNQWTELTRFIENPGIPPDNNRSESALRVRRPRQEELSIPRPRAGRPGPRRRLLTCRDLHGQRQGSARPT